MPAQGQGGRPGSGQPGFQPPPGGMNPNGPRGSGSAPPGGMMGSNPFGGQQGEREEDAFETYVIAVVEVAKTMHDNEKLNMKQYIHKWGYTKAYNDNATIQTFLVSAPSMKSRFTAQHSKAIRGENPDLLVSCAMWALNHGMVEECIEALDELAKKAELNDHFKKIAEAFTKAKAIFAKSSAGTESVNSWKTRLPDY